MFAWLLAFIPAPWLAALKLFPWRLVGAIAAAIVAVSLVLMVNSWRVESNRMEGAQKALTRSRAALGKCTSQAAIVQEAYAAALARVQATDAANRAAAQEVERELQAKLAAAAAGSRDLGRRLRDYQNRRCSGALPAVAAAVSGAPQAGGESGGQGEVERRLDEYHAACDRDAARLDALEQLLDRAEAIAAP